MGNEIYTLAYFPVAAYELNSIFVFFKRSLFYAYIFAENEFTAVAVFLYTVSYKKFCIRIDAEKSFKPSEWS